MQHKSPYPRRPPAKAMTIAASFQFDEGVLLCADRLITHGRPSSPDSFGSYQEKVWELTCLGFSAVITGAGSPHTMKVVADKVLQTLKEEQGPEEEFYQLPVGMIEAALSEAIEEAYQSIDPQIDGADMILAVNQYVSGITVFRNADRLVKKIGTSEITGLGENSLAGFLLDNLYQPSMNQGEITAFAALLVYAAKIYCPQYCGGTTDIKILRRRGRQVINVPATTVDHLEAFFRRRTKDYIRDLLDGAIQSLI